MFGLPGCEGVSDTTIKTVSLAEVQDLVASRDRNSRAVLIVDPRGKGEFDRGHIAGAKNIGLPDVPAEGVPDPIFDQHAVVVVYGNDPASAVARGMTKRLLTRDISQARLFLGGLEAWRASGGAVETTPGVGPPEPVTPE